MHIYGTCLFTSMVSARLQFNLGIMGLNLRQVIVRVVYRTRCFNIGLWIMLNDLHKKIESTL